MGNLRSELTAIVDNAEKVLENQITLFLDAQELYAGNDWLLFVYAHSVEMATYFYYMAKASRGLGVYTIEGDLDFAKTDVYDAFQAIDRIHTESPNERSKVSRDILMDALTALKENNTEQSRELAATFGQISDTSRISFLEHLESIKQELGKVDTMVH